MSKKIFQKKSKPVNIKLSKKDILLIFLSAVCLNLSFIGNYLGFLAWVGFVPFLLSLHKRTLITRWKLSFFFGLLFFLGLIYWISHVSIIGMLLMVFFLALGFSWFGLFCPEIDHPLCLFAAPVLLIALEKLRGIFFGGFLWGILGYTQFQNIWLIQSADIFGVWGISFLVMLVNTAIAQAIIKKQRIHLARLNCWLPIVLLALNYAYGFYAINTKNFELPGCRISVIQPNIAQEHKWDPDYRIKNIETLCALSEKAARDNPDLIIWPETSVPGYLLDEPDLYRKVIDLSKQIGTHLLVGAPREDYVESSYFNSVFLFGKHGNLKKFHDKIHLVPFGEYIPYRSVLGFLDFTTIADFSAGNRFTVFQFLNNQDKEINFAVLVCFEDIFPGLVQKFRKNHVDFLVNVTNEAWFGKSTEPIQHTAISVFRAIENRCWFLRSANTGISCVIDPNGNIKVKVQDKKTGQDIFIQGILTYNIE
jgi:apolipoprotein N-acyltransferase